MNDLPNHSASAEPSETEERAARDLRIIEAMIFAADRPVGAETLAAQLPEGADIEGRLAELATLYRHRGVQLVRAAGGWTFRTAPDLAGHLTVHRIVRRRPSRAALETLAIIAYHQPVTRAEVEDIRGVGLSRGTLDLLLEAGWVAPKGRRRSPGRPIMWVTTPAFLEHFGLASLDDLPGLDELKAAGLLSGADARLGEGRPAGDGEAGQVIARLPLDEDDGGDPDSAASPAEEGVPETGSTTVVRPSGKGEAS